MTNKDVLFNDVINFLQKQELFASMRMLIGQERNSFHV